MKRFIIFSLAVILLIFLGGYAYYYQGWYVDLNPDAPVVSQTAVEGKTILLDQGSGLEEFEIRGVDLGTGIPAGRVPGAAGQRRSHAADDHPVLCGYGGGFCRHAL